jgi:serine protease Do
MAFLTDRAIDDLAGVADALRRVTVIISADVPSGRSASTSRGSGIIWSSDGTIVTNAHVATADRLAVTFCDGRLAPASVIARDRRRDLALLRVDLRKAPDPLPIPVIGTPIDLRPGELVLALGHPFGVEHALAMGVVHAAPDGRRSPYVAADIRLAPGNSGGPLADARGRIVGVNSMIVGGLGVAISADVVRRMVSRVAARVRARSSTHRDAA